MDGGEGGIKKRQRMEKEDSKEVDTENENKIEAKMVHIPSHIFLHFFFKPAWYLRMLDAMRVSQN